MLPPLPILQRTCLESANCELRAVDQTLACQMHELEHRKGSQHLGLRAVRMTCRDTIHLICMYLEGKLSPSVQGEIERHLHGCGDCRLVLNAATTTLDRYFGAGRASADPKAA